MATIEVSFDTYKKLTLLRENENDSYDDVIIRLLNKNSNIAGYDSEKEVKVYETMTSNRVEARKGDWVVQNVRFPEGTEFRGKHRGAYYNAIVKDGALFYENHRFSSPSGAASKIRGYNQNGWLFWECRYPNTDTWIKIIDYYNGTDE